MKLSLGLLTVLLAASFLVVGASVPVVHAQESDVVRTYVPASSIERPEDRGVRAHTNIIVSEHANAFKPPVGAETPGSLACIYHTAPVHTPGCPIATSTSVPLGGVGAIALVDAFDNPNAVQDMTTYTSTFGLPAPTFQVVFADGTRPANDAGGWSLEEALDIEMAVATAPKAQIFLVEAHDNSFENLYLAEQVASNLVAAAGGGVVSNSWSGGEYPGEQTDEKTFFATPGVVYFASTGDDGINNIGVPAVFDNVVAAGGTTINRDSDGNFQFESWWTGGGGGSSAQVATPQYQSVVSSVVGTHRGVPDMSAVGNPNTGVAMYDLDGLVFWIQIGGTSVSSPFLAGLIDAAGSLETSSRAELTKVYREYVTAHEYQNWWRDIKFGGAECGTGWDFCTGLGAPLGYGGK